MDLLERSIRSRTEKKEFKGVLRDRSPNASMLDFWSGDYLGIRAQLILNGLLKTEPHHIAVRQNEFENMVAEFHRSEAAVLLNNGYMAQVALCSALPDRFTTVLYDEYCSPGLKDGLWISASSNRYKFKHNNIGELEKFLEKSRGRSTIIVVESVYGISGDFCPLETIAELATQYKATLVVDESHAVGLYGGKGEGLIVQYGLESKVFARIFGMENALGCSGGVILGSKLLKDFVQVYSRHYSASFLMPGLDIDKLSKSYSLLAEKQDTIRDLCIKIAYFRKQLSSSSLKWQDNITPIQLLHTGNAASSTRIYDQLIRRNFAIDMVSSSLMYKGDEYLRVSLHHSNTNEEIDELISYIHDF